MPLPGGMGGLSTVVQRVTIAAMPATPSHRRQIKHYHEPGDVHELTFSCHRRLPLLSNDAWQALLAQAVDRALAAREFALVAFVFTPEHVHLLVYPRKRGLGTQPTDWRWSSARWYASDGRMIDESLPHVAGLPAEFF